MGFDPTEALSASPPDLSTVKNMQAWHRRRLSIDGNAFVLTGAS